MVRFGSEEVVDIPEPDYPPDPEPTPAGLYVQDCVLLVVRTSTVRETTKGQICSTPVRTVGARIDQDLELFAFDSGTIVVMDSLKVGNILKVSGDVTMHRWTANGHDRANLQMHVDTILKIA